MTSICKELDSTDPLEKRNHTAYTYCMAKRRIVIKDKKLKQLIKKEGREGAKKDFFELLKRATR